MHRLLSDPLESFGQLDAVIHLAWQGLPNYNSLFHYEENLPDHYRFLKSFIAAGVRQLLVTGTGLEYGMQDGALNEITITAPVNPYALAKDTLHKCLQSLRQSAREVDQHQADATAAWRLGVAMQLKKPGGGVDGGVR